MQLKKYDKGFSALQPSAIYFQAWDAHFIPNQKLLL